MIPGHIARAYVVRCYLCCEYTVYYARCGNRITKKTTVRSARQNGWSKTKNGWAHKECVNKLEGG